MKSGAVQVCAQSYLFSIGRDVEKFLNSLCLLSWVLPPSDHFFFQNEDNINLIGLCNDTIKYVFYVKLVAEGLLRGDI